MGKTVRVLVVEDEALICSFIEDALCDGGFEACSVHSGEAAMSTFRDGREGCRALLTDVNLGDGISGWELARQIREIPVVYMTGASAPDWKSQGVVGSILIQKLLRRRNWRPPCRSYSIRVPRQAEPGSG